MQPITVLMQGLMLILLKMVLRQMSQLQFMSLYGQLKLKLRKLIWLRKILLPSFGVLGFDLTIHGLI